MAWFGIQKRQQPGTGSEEAIGFVQAKRQRRTKPNPAVSQLSVDTTPTPSRRLMVQHMDAASHAAALLELLQEADYPRGYQLNYAELSKVYREMCAQNRWRVRGWISVGRAFDLLTTNGEKPYANFWTEDGRAQRLRVYRIPAKTGSISPVSVSRAA